MRSQTACLNPRPDRFRPANVRRLSCERATARRRVRRGGCRATDALDSSASAAVRAAATLVGLPSRLGRRAENIARLSASGRS